ncbi:MAG: 23S rRNA (adenine(2503)-C(2))-methyltransferase RlmN [Clostridiales bacterium]|nr:23S rRNA (adenine(2503)-C(2))-methyltransferase RlmN [Clostridiales bacterium]
MAAEDAGRPALLDMTPGEIAEAIAPLGQPAYRAAQVYSWLCRGVGFTGMTNLPLALRETLETSFRTGLAVIAERRDSRRDDTRKYLFALDDGERVEGVRMTYRHGHTLCISTQVGCRMGCAFCASTLGGRVRDLTAGEMLAQIIAANGDLGGQRIGNVVMMGSGEPLDNYAASIAFLRRVRLPEGLGIGLRSVSLSTCGLVPEMRALATEGLPVTLSVSLHAPDDETRRRIMPIARRYAIGEVVDAARHYVERTGRRVIFEYALIRDVNDRPEQASRLAGLLRGMQCHVNLITLSGVPETGLLAARRERAAEFERELVRRGVSVTRRRQMGSDIEGACGQLRRRSGGKE